MYNNQIIRLATCKDQSNTSTVSTTGSTIAVTYMERVLNYSSLSYIHTSSSTYNSIAVLCIIIMYVPCVEHNHELTA